MKKALQPVPEPPNPKEPTREDLIDEYGKLDRAWQEFKPRKDRYEALKTIIKSWYDEHPADQPALAIGNAYTIQVTARENEATPNKAGLFKILKKAKFLELCEITQKAIREALGEPAIAKYFSKVQTGSRTLKAVPKESPTVCAASALKLPEAVEV